DGAGRPGGARVLAEWPPVPRTRVDEDRPARLRADAGAPEQDARDRDALVAAAGGARARELAQPPVEAQPGADDRALVGAHVGQRGQPRDPVGGGLSQVL